MEHGTRQLIMASTKHPKACFVSIPCRLKTRGLHVGAAWMQPRGGEKAALQRVTSAPVQPPLQLPAGWATAGTPPPAPPREAAVPAASVLTYDSPHGGRGQAPGFAMPSRIFQQSGSPQGQVGTPSPQVCPGDLILSGSPCLLIRLVRPRHDWKQER